jgi:hypothetical protein
MALLRLSPKNRTSTPTVTARGSECVTKAPEWGVPGPCAECGADPVVDMVDPCMGVVHLHCSACNHMWDVRRDTP